MKPKTTEVVMFVREFLFCFCGRLVLVDSILLSFGRCETFPSSLHTLSIVDQLVPSCHPITLSCSDIRIQQRNGRKSLTTVQGLSEDLDFKKILRYFKKAYSTNGTIIEDQEMGSVIRTLQML
jgi:hypothetical protein